ncbi:MAG: hypothetical protein IJA34_02570 [Lachnospiraceae bacterium]|nr:hypothetical protein [Lachnospiraceae bacterium]
MSRILEEYADIYKDFIDESQKLYKTLGLGNNTKQIIENIYAQNHEKMVKGLSEIFHANSMENEAKDCRNFIDSKIANSMFWSKSVITSDNLAANRMEMKNFLEEIEDVEYEIKGAIYDMDSLDNNKELVTSLQELIHAFIKSIDVAEKMMSENLSKSEVKDEESVGKQEKLEGKLNEKGKTILEINDPSVNSQKEKSDENIDFSAERFSEVNINIFINVLEDIVTQEGVEELNEAVERHYKILLDCRRNCVGKNEEKKTKFYAINNEFLGGYTVTDKTLQMIKPIYEKINLAVVEKDKFYKEKFASLESGFDKVNGIIHTIASAISLFGFGPLPFADMFKNKNSNLSIKENVSKIMSLRNFTPVGQMIIQGSRLLRVIDFSMPFIKKSKILVRLNEKHWELVRKEASDEYRYLDQYIMEYYEMKYGMHKATSKLFDNFLDVAIKIESNERRRVFDSAVFSANSIMSNILIPQDNKREIGCGTFLNLVRAGMMCGDIEIPPRTASSMVDDLRDVYIKKWGIEPKVDISPEMIFKSVMGIM